MPAAAEGRLAGTQPVPTGSVAVPVSFGMNQISFQPFVIGVAGGSGSGKSTVSQQVLASFGAEMVSVVMQDDYYCDQTHLTPEVRRKQNYDHPQAFDWPLLVPVSYTHLTLPTKA